MPLNVAVMVVVFVAETTRCVTWKLAEAEPAGTVTDEGTVATLGLELTRVILSPLAAPNPLSVTAPVMTALDPPTTEFEVRVKLVNVGAVIVRTAVCVVEPAKAAEMVAVVVVTTPFVDIVKVATVEPVATVTDAGTTASAFLEDKRIVVPPVGATPESVTVPVLGAPPTTEDGAKVSPVSSGAKIVRFAGLLLVPALAVITTVSVLATPCVVMLNVAEDAPEGIVTDVGIPASELLEDKATVVPDEPAA